MIETILLYALLSSSLYYLGSRAMITKWLWSRYPPRFASFMDCAACSGFWYGALLSGFGRLAKLPPIIDEPLLQAITIGLLMITLTPITAGLMQRGFDSLGTIDTTNQDTPE